MKTLFWMSPSRFFSSCVLMTIPWASPKMAKNIDSSMKTATNKYVSMMMEFSSVNELLSISSTSKSPNSARMRDRMERRIE